MAERCKLLDAVAGEINRRFDDFLQAEIADTSKPAPPGLAWTFAQASANGPNLHRHHQEHGHRVVQHAYARRQNCAELRRVRVPHGVIAVVCPDLPLLLLTWKVGPALACGNTVVVKP